MSDAIEDQGERGGEEIDTLKAFVESVQHLPLFTGTAMQLIQSVDREDTSATELSRLISTDVTLASHLLRIVNSSYYGLTRKIGTVSEALALLGLNLVRRTVSAAVLQRPLFAYLHDTEIARAFWRHELLCAALARHLALRRGEDGEFAYMAGLLHDVGRLVMLMHFPQHRDALLEKRDVDDAFSLDRERLRFGFDHAQVGAALLESWGLPERMVQAAHQHIDEAEPDDPIAASVWHGNLLTHRMADLPEENDDEQPWMAEIGLDAETRRRIYAEISALESGRE